jgi:hypothetical protein
MVCNALSLIGQLPPTRIVKLPISNPAETMRVAAVLPMLRTPADFLGAWRGGITEQA